MRKQDDALMLEIYQLLQAPGKKSLYQIIEDKKESMSLSNFQIAKILGIDKSTFNRQIEKLAKGTVDNMDFYLILKICHFLGIGIEEMSQIFVASLSPEKIKELEQARKANYIISNFDIKGLKDQGFLDTTSDFEKIEKRIVKFFGLDSIFQYSSEVGAVAFSRTKKTSHDKMREFWVRSAFFQFEKIKNPNDFSKEELLAIIPKIKPYTRYESKGFHTVIQALYNVGVTVIVQSYLAKTQVRGGTFIVNGKPCVVVTDYNKSYATLWFALLHELYHVIFDFEELKTLKYHLTGEAQSELYLFKEDYADHFACEMLFPKEKLNFIKHRISSPLLVNDYAEKNSVHPSIIYSFYCYEEKVKNNNDVYAFYQQYFGKPDKALHVVRTNPWNLESINDNLEIVNKILSPKI